MQTLQDRRFKRDRCVEVRESPDQPHKAPDAGKLVRFNLSYSDSPPAHVLDTVVPYAKWDDEVSIEVHAVDFAGWVVEM